MRRGGTVVKQFLTPAIVRLREVIRAVINERKLTLMGLSRDLGYSEPALGRALSRDEMEGAVLILRAAEHLGIRVEFKITAPRHALYGHRDKDWYTYEHINAVTGFANRPPFQSRAEVKQFFRPVAQRKLWGDLAETGIATLRRFGELVWKFGWNCSGFTGVQNYEYLRISQREEADRINENCGLISIVAVWLEDDKVVSVAGLNPGSTDLVWCPTCDFPMPPPSQRSAIRSARMSKQPLDLENRTELL